MGELTPHERHVVSDNDDFRMVMDEHRLPRDAGGFDQVCVMHITFRKFGKAALKHCAAVWRAFRACVPCPLFAYPNEDDEKWERFVRRHGFQPISSFLCTDGKTRRVFVSYPSEDSFHARDHNDLRLHASGDLAVGRSTAVPA